MGEGLQTDFTTTARSPGGKGQAAHGAPHGPWLCGCGGGALPHYRTAVGRGRQEVLGDKRLGGAMQQEKGCFL